MGPAMRRLLPFVLLSILVSCSDRPESPLLARSRRVFGTLPRAMQNDSPALVRLGEQLYHSTELSVNRTQSCSSCHPVVHAYENTSDRGVAEVTGRDHDEYVFKIAALRNVAATGPCFHDGRIPTLSHAVERMAWHQLGMKIAPRERDAIVAFLGALTDRP